MRRSQAPSIRGNSAKFNSQKIVPTISNVQLSFDERKRSKTESEVYTNNDKNSIKSSSENKIIYNIVWSKLSTKKHKTWEGDGILEIKNKTSVLKDITGSVLGTSNSIKSEDLYEGNRLVIGSKEFEIQEQLTSMPCPIALKREIEEENDSESKKKKVETVFKPTLCLPTRICHNLKYNKNDFELLKLPDPDYSHQWKFNEKKLPINHVYVSNSLVKHLRPHQREGVTFLYECLQGFRNLDYFGAILADDMGLGKTLQSLAVCHTLLKKSAYGGEPTIRRVLIVTPSSLTETWNKEIVKWLNTERLFAYVIDAKHKLSQYSRQIHVPFIIVSYEMFINNYNDFENINFDLLICDEGHRLKNSSIKAVNCLKQLNIQRKVILTGTPLQNNLQEFYSLIDFVNPGILGSYQEFKHRFETPIVQSQSPDASEDIIKIGNEKALELNRITNKFVLRRTQNVNIKYLPKKKEFIVFVRPSELQKSMLSKVLEWYDDSLLKKTSPLQIITFLKKICNHPSLIQTTKKTDDLLTKHLIQFLPAWSEMGPFDSGKLELVQNFLQETIDRKEKIVIVSNYTKTLDMLMGLCEHFNYNYSRLDGNTQNTERFSRVEKFNRSNFDIPIFLLSAKAGGVGLNLHGASRLILFDNDWNPATDLQAMSRIWRDGQKSDVKIYRLITAGTIEEKIFQRQIAKTSLGGCVIGQTCNMNTMKFSQEELKDLFTIQDDFKNCATHDILGCDCQGTGEDSTRPKDEKIVDDPLQLSIDQDEGNSPLQMNELIYWKHYKPPLADDILKEACLTNSTENIVFMFCNETTLK